MAIIDGIISGGISNITDFFGKNPPKPKKTGNASQTLKEAQSLYKSQKPEKSAVIKETLNVLGDLFIYKVIHLKKDKDGIKMTPYLEILKSGNNGGETQEIEDGTDKLRKQLETFANKSEVSALLLKQALENPDFNFCLVTDNETLEALRFKPYDLAMYLPAGRDKLFIVSAQNIEDFANRGKFNEIISHELIHGGDDFACKDKDTEKPEFLSKDKFKKEIQSMLAAEIEKTKKLFEDLKKIRIKKLKEKKPDISEAEIKDDMAQRPLFRVDADSAEEVELIKNSTWCWHDMVEGKISAPLVSYMEEGYTLDNTKHLDRLTLEYAAYGVQFFISDDASKKERLQKQVPDFYAFLEKKFIPAITNKS